MHSNRSTDVIARLACGVAVSLVAACSGASGLPRQSSAESIATRHGWSVIDYHPKSNVDVSTARKERDVSSSSSVPFYTSAVTSPADGNTYIYDIVGTNPRTNKITTKISIVPIVLKVQFANGSVLDPTKPGCSDTVSVANRFFDGPDFVATPQTSNGVNVGTVQLIDAHMRAEFWQYAQNSGYHVEFSAVRAPIVVTFDAASESGNLQMLPGVCPGSGHDIGITDVTTFDNIAEGIAREYATATQVPLILTYNFVLSLDGGTQCCVLGYHSDFSRVNGTQFYAAAAYLDPGLFPAPVEDINDWTHELGEFVNDPFGNNGTPAWGDTGQVPDGSCQNNLEVGDPLSGTDYPVVLNGFTYHPQELAFFDWFFRTPSEGTGGRYSYEGTFTSSAGAVCVPVTPTPLPTP